MIEFIKHIINENDSERMNEEEYKMEKIILLLASSERYSKLFFNMYQQKINQQKELILDLNAELSRALFTLENKGNINPAWVASQIKDFYKDNQQVKCDFKIKENE